MDNGDHITRTLLMSQKQPGILMVSRGSSENIDEDAGLLSSGHAQIRAFNVSNLTDTSPSYDFSTSGRLLGWGLRNSVGIAEEPLTGGIFSVENSADQVTRNGVDIHEDDPGEEMNFHGYLNGSTDHQGGNHGYPDCFALWDTNIPDAGSLKVGDQFTMTPNSTFNDTTCATSRIPPILTFQAHMAPLDIIFTPDGSQAFISFHGSWDRSVPVGHKVSIVEFTNGSPVEAPDSKTALTDIFTNANDSECTSLCLRPVGLAMDDEGRLFISSDASGEIWVLAKSGSASSSGSSTSTSGIPSPTAISTSSGTSSSTASSKTSQIWLRTGTRWSKCSFRYLLLSLIPAIYFNF
jgi:glucose/arabinose dehydrogenase